MDTNTEKVPNNRWCSLMANSNNVELSPLFITRMTIFPQIRKLVKAPISSVWPIACVWRKSIFAIGTRGKPRTKGWPNKPRSAASSLKYAAWHTQVWKRANRQTVFIKKYCHTASFGTGRAPWNCFNGTCKVKIFYQESGDLTQTIPLQWRESFPCFRLSCSLYA